jgi:hypothetical protein
MAIDYVALRNELLADPRAYGYQAFRDNGDDLSLAELLNRVRDGSGGFAAIQIRRADISPDELLNVLDLRDLSVPPSVPSPALAAAWLESALQAPRLAITVPGGSTDNLIKDNLDLLVGNTNGSQTRLNALARRNGSRAEELFGTGTRINDQDIARALRAT